MTDNRRGRMSRGNPVAQNPLLRKGGPHQKTRSAERRNQQQILHSELEEWREELEWQNREPVSSDTGSSFFARATQITPPPQ